VRERERGKKKEESVERTGQQPNEILHRDFVAAIVDFNVLAVEVERVATIRKDASGEVVARVAGRVVAEHEDNVRVRYAETFHGSIPALFVVGTLFRGTDRGRETHIPNVLAICYPINKRLGAR